MKPKRLCQTLAPGIVILLLLFASFINTENCFSQDFIPKLNPVRSIQRDSDNFYFNTIWIQSKDINSNDASGFMRRAGDKTALGYYREALADLKSAMAGILL